MNRQEIIKNILERIIKQTNKITNISQNDIDKAIIYCRGVDPRTLHNWFTVLWKLEYLTQPTPGFYSLNLERITELEISFTLTQSLERR